MPENVGLNQKISNFLYRGGGAKFSGIAHFIQKDVI